MNQMLSILNTMCRLQKSAYNPDRDNAGILEVYKAILEIANDKQGYIQKSEGIINALTENGLSEKAERPFSVKAFIIPSDF